MAKYKDKEKNHLEESEVIWDKSSYFGKRNPALVSSNRSDSDLHISLNLSNVSFALYKQWL